MVEKRKDELKIGQRNEMKIQYWYINWRCYWYDEVVSVTFNQSTQRDKLGLRDTSRQPDELEKGQQNKGQHYILIY